MVTQSHVVLNIALLSKRDKPFLHFYAFIGAVLPDLPMFIFFAVETFIRKTPQREIWDSRYFMEAWQTFFDIFNAVPLILIVLGIGYYLLHSDRIVIFAWSMLLHCGFDFITHHDDGHHHFFPLSDFVFESPISYWDDEHYAGIVAPIERSPLFPSVMGYRPAPSASRRLYLFPRLKTRIGRGALVVINVLFLGSYLLFFLLTLMNSLTLGGSL